MAYIVNKFVRFLTKRHDARNARQNTYEPGLNGRVELTECEQIPSVMLAFHLIDTIPEEKKLVRLMRKVFEKNPNVKDQYGQAGETLLYAACKKGLLLLVQFFVENGVNCLIVTPLGSPYHGLLQGLLDTAMSVEIFEAIAGYLHDQGCDVNAVNHRKMSPFLYAVEQSHLAAMRLFVSLDCDVNVHGGLPAYHALHFACLHSRPDLVKYLLSLPSLHREPMSQNGSTPLYLILNEWTDMFYKRTKAESNHQQVRVKGHLQLSLMVENLLLAGMLKDAATFVGFNLPNIKCLQMEIVLSAGADPFTLSTNKPVNLAKNLLQIRKEETNRGRWCSMCCRPISEMDKSHDCTDAFTGCPCKLTPLLTGNEDADAPPTSPQPANRYGNTAVPFTSQILATVLLYASHHYRCRDMYEAQLSQCMDFNAGMTDPYVDHLLRFCTRSGPEAYNTPLSLKILTRSVIRVEVGEKWGQLAELPIPRQILDFLSMKVLV